MTPEVIADDFEVGEDKKGLKKLNIHLEKQVKYWLRNPTHRGNREIIHSLLNDL